MSANSDEPKMKVLMVVPSCHLETIEGVCQEAGLDEIAEYYGARPDHNFDGDASIPYGEIDCICVFMIPSAVVDKLISKCTNAKWVHSLSAGVDTILGGELSKRSDIVLTNAKGAFSQSLAEFAMLGLSLESFEIMSLFTSCMLSVGGPHALITMKLQGTHSKKTKQPSFPFDHLGSCTSQRRCIRL